MFFQGSRCSDLATRQETGMRQMRLVLDILRVHPYFAPPPHRCFSTPPESEFRAFFWQLEAISIEYGQAHLAGERAKAVSGPFLVHFWDHFGTILRYFHHQIWTIWIHMGLALEEKSGGALVQNESPLRFWSSSRRAAEIHCQRNSSRRSALTQRQSKTARDFSQTWITWGSKHRNWLRFF